MQKILIFLQIFVGCSFLLYGAGCFLSEKAKKEFIRYKMAEFRQFVGTAQIGLGGMMVLGFYSRALLLFSAVSLCLMMGTAVIVRRNIKDSLFMSLPAILYFFATATIAISIFYI